MSRKIRYSMVGGGRGAFIGAVHRIAATAMDEQIDLISGALSPGATDRCCGTFEEMNAKEKARRDDGRLDFVAIITPNYMHFPPAKAENIDVGNTDKKGREFYTDVPQASPGFHLKGSYQYDWGLKNSLSGVSDPKDDRTAMLAFDHGYFQGRTTGLERVDQTIRPDHSAVRSLRIMAELGANVVKCYYTDEGFDTITSCPSSSGRNIFQSDNLVAMMQAVSGVVHNDIRAGVHQRPARPRSWHLQGARRRRGQPYRHVYSAGNHGSPNLVGLPTNFLRGRESPRGAHVQQHGPPAAMRSGVRAVASHTKIVLPGGIAGPM